MHTTKRVLLFISLPILISVQAFAQSTCRDDKILNTNGRMIRLSSGWVLQGYPGSNATMSSWLPLDKVVVCPLGGSAYSITDSSQRNSTIKALRQMP